MSTYMSSRTINLKVNRKAQINMLNALARGIYTTYNFIKHTIIHTVYLLLYLYHVLLPYNTHTYRNSPDPIILFETVFG